MSTAVHYGGTLLFIDDNDMLFEVVASPL